MTVGVDKRLYNQYGTDFKLHLRRDRPYIVNPYQMIANNYLTVSALPLKCQFMAGVISVTRLPDSLLYFEGEVFDICLKYCYNVKKLFVAYARKRVLDGKTVKKTTYLFFAKH